MIRPGIFFRNDGIPHFVEFTNSSPNNVLPMPSKHYLKLHAACAKVANMSGTAEYLKKLEEDREAGTVLAFDDSSANVLDNALREVYLSGKDIHRVYDADEHLSPS